MSDQPRCVLGIDIGDEYCCVSMFTEGKGSEILENERGKRKIPSILAYSNSELLFGDEAKGKLTRDPSSCVRGIKHGLLAPSSSLTTTTSSESKNNVAAKSASRKSSDSKRSEWSLQSLDPVTHYAWVLKQLMMMAVDKIGYPVHGAVVSVPSYFTLEHRNQIVQCGKLIDLNILRVIDDSFATMVAVSDLPSPTIQDGDVKGKGSAADRLVVTVDCGATAIHCSAASIGDGMITMMGTHSCCSFSGKMIDDLLFKEVVSKLDKPIDLASKMKERLMLACENAKRNLSVSGRASIEVEGMLNGGSEDLRTFITRERFEELIAPLVDKVTAPIYKMLTEAKIEPTGIVPGTPSMGGTVQPLVIDEVVLVGGSSRIPSVQTRLRTFFGNRELKKTVNADESVAIGCAIVASQLSQFKGGFITDATWIRNSPTISIVVEGFRYPVFDSNHSIPCEKKMLVYTSKADQREFLVKCYQSDSIVATCTIILPTATTGTTGGTSAWPKGTCIVLRMTIEADMDISVKAQMADNDVPLTCSVEMRKLSDQRLTKIASELAALDTLTTAALHSEAD